MGIQQSRTLFGYEIEVHPQILIILDLVSDNVEHVATYPVIHF